MENVGKINLNILVHGFGGCKQEIMASLGPVYDIQRFGINFVTVPEDADVLVVMGFLNETSKKRAVELYSRMSQPRWVIALGSCAIQSDLFKNLKDRNKEVPESLKAAVYVPGCPPRPEAFIYAILKLLDKE